MEIINAKQKFKNIAESCEIYYYGISINMKTIFEGNFRKFLRVHRNEHKNTKKIFSKTLGNI